MKAPWLVKMLGAAVVMEDFDNTCYGETTGSTVEVNAKSFGNNSYGQRSKGAQNGSNRKCTYTIIALVIIYITVKALLLALVGACIVFTLEISRLESGTASSQTAFSLQGSQNALVSRIENVENLLQQFQERILDQLNDTVKEVNVKLSQGFSAIDSNIQMLNISIESINSSLRSGRQANDPALSCAALLPSLPSGYYWVRASNGSAVRVYCDMTRSCGGVTGGWMRVAELDMTNSSHQCPSGLRLRTASNIHACKIPSGACSSVNLTNLQSLEYSRVCGGIQGYQVGSTDSFGIFPHSGGVRLSNATIEQNYVDGISLTHGHPRQHIWTFAAALDEVGPYPSGNCPCINVNQESEAKQPPAYIGMDYFCDMASAGRFVNNRFYRDDPLWDGAGCGPQNTCCSFNNPPWFYKQLPQPTTDDIEMRVCRDQPDANDENVAIEIIEIFVQ